MPGKERESTTTFIRINSEMEGMEIANILEESGIPARVISQQVPWYDGVFQLAQGYWGEVLVPPEFHEKARKILEERPPRSAFTDEELEEISRMAVPQEYPED